MEYDATETRDMMIAIDFNSHTHVEYDQGDTPTSTEHVISTHTLTWSTTRSQEPRAEDGAFQLTHSRGVRRPGSAHRRTAPPDFNSHTHVEYDVARCAGL